MIRRAVLLAVLGLLALAGLALPAYAATGAGAGADGGTGTGAQIRHFEQSPGGLSMLVTVPADAQVDLAHVAVTIAGRQTSSTAQAGSSGTVRRVAILVMDTSRSMSGARFAAAQSAAAAFVAAVPKDVYLGIVTFGGTVRTALAPTQDRGRATSTLDHLALSGGTLLYDGVQAALDDAGEQGQRSLLVLSDGADTRSTASLSQAAEAVLQDKALLNVVALDPSGPVSPALQQLARAGAGSVVPAGTTALTRALTDQAGALTRQVAVVAAIPAGITQGTVTLTLPTVGGGTLTTSAYDNDLQPPPPAPVVARSTGWVPPSWALYPAVGAVALGLFVLLVSLIPRRAPSGAEALVTSYTERTGAAPSGAPGSAAASGTGRGLPRVEAQQVLSSARTAAADLLQRNATVEARIARALDGAGSDLKPAEWLLVHVVVAVGATLLGLLLGRGGVLVALLFLAAGVVGPWLFLRVRRGRRRKRFAEALPDTLQLMAGSLSAGLSLAQTVDTVVREGWSRSPGSSAGRWSRPGSGSTWRTRWRASPTGSRARTSAGS